MSPALQKYLHKRSYECHNTFLLIFKNELFGAYKIGLTATCFPREIQIYRRGHNRRDYGRWLNMAKKTYLFQFRFRHSTNTVCPQSLCPLFVCIASNKDFRNPVFSTWQSGFCLQYSLSGNIRKVLQNNRKRYNNTMLFSLIQSVYIGHNKDSSCGTNKFTSTDSFPPVEEIINVSRFLMVYFEDWPEGFNSSLSFVWIGLSWRKKYSM